MTCPPSPPTLTAANKPSSEEDKPGSSSALHARPFRVSLRPLLERVVACVRLLFAVLFYSDSPVSAFRQRHHVTPRCP